jgi:hypothetical protein
MCEADVYRITRTSGKPYLICDDCRADDPDGRIQEQRLAREERRAKKRMESVKPPPPLRLP